MEIVFAWDAASDGAPPGGNQRYVTFHEQYHVFLKAVALLGVMIEVMTVAVIGTTAYLEDGEVADEVEAGEEDMMTTVEKIGTVIEAEEVDMMMITVDEAGAEDGVVGMEVEVGMAEIDMIAEVAEVADMGFRLARLDHWGPLHPMWDMAMAQTTQSAGTGHHPFKLPLLLLL
jgi:hypothetical protein